eukprot:gene36120-44545_t
MDYLHFKKAVKSEHTDESSISAALFHASVVRSADNDEEVSPFASLSEKFAENEHISIFSSAMTPREDEYSPGYKMVFVDEDQFATDKKHKEKDLTDKKDSNETSVESTEVDSSPRTSHLLFERASIGYEMKPVEYNAVEDREQVVQGTEEFHTAAAVNAANMFSHLIQPDVHTEKATKKVKNALSKSKRQAKKDQEHVEPVKSQTETIIDTVNAYLNEVMPDEMQSKTLNTDCEAGQNKATAAPNCIWNADASAEYGGTCDFRDPPSDIYFTMIIVLLTTICTVPLQMAFDYIRVEYCSKRPDFSVFGWNSEYMVGRATQDLGKGMGTETALKTLYDKVDHDRETLHGDVLAKSPRSVVADKTPVDAQTLTVLKRKFLHNNLIASKVYMDTNS